MKSIIVFILFFLAAIQYQDVFGQDNPNGISVQIAGAYGVVNGNISAMGFPFGLANNGPSVHAGVYFWVGENWGFNVMNEFSWHTYRSEEAGHYLLAQDALASIATVSSGSYYIHSLSPGIFYNINLNRKWTLISQVGVGMAAVFTPEISIELITEPLTQINYKSGSTTSIQYNASLHPTFRIHQHLGLNGFFQLMYGSPAIEIEENGSQITSQNISFTRLSLGIGLTWYFGKKVTKVESIP